MKRPVGSRFSEEEMVETECVSGGAEQRVGIRINGVTDGGSRLQLRSYCGFLFVACLVISHAGSTDDPIIVE